MAKMCTTISAEAKTKVPATKKERDAYIEDAVRSYVKAKPKKLSHEFTRYTAKENVWYEIDRDLVGEMIAVNTKIPYCKLLNDAILRV